MGQLQVPDLAAVLVPPQRRPQVHILVNTLLNQPSPRDDSVSARIYEPCAARALADGLTCPFTSKRGLCNRLTAEARGDSPALWLGFPVRLSGRSLFVAALSAAAHALGEGGSGLSALVMSRTARTRPFAGWSAGGGSDFSPDGQCCARTRQHRRVTGEDGERRAGGQRGGGRGCAVQHGVRGGFGQPADDAGLVR